MNVFSIVNQNVEILKSYINIEVLNSNSTYTNIIWNQQIENICLLHNIGMYKTI